jgi:hypothetical protein
MPHLVLAGPVDLAQALGGVELDARRWGRAVLKSDQIWYRDSGGAALVEGVVVEHSRPLHPVALVAARDDDLVVRLWQRAPAERSTNLAAELIADLQLTG